MNVSGLLFCILIWGITFSILSHKNRGWGYYVLTIFMPLIGLIVALCLKKKSATNEEYTETPSLDITNDMTNQKNN